MFLSFQTTLFSKVFVCDFKEGRFAPKSERCLLVDFAGGYVEAPLGHPAHASLRIARAVHVDAVNVGSFACVLEVADGGVALATQVDQVRVRIVEGKEDAVAVVQLFHAEARELFGAGVDFLLKRSEV